MYYQRARPIKTSSLEEWAHTNRRDKGRLVRERRSHAIVVYDGEKPIV